MNKQLFERILELSGQPPILTEDLETMWERGFSRMPKNDFYKMVNLDPTATTERPGKYFRQLYDLYRAKKLKLVDLALPLHFIEKAHKSSHIE